MAAVVILLIANVGVTASAAQTIGLNRVMRAKLEHAQQILGDVVTSNWSGLEQHSQELRRAAEDPAWAVLTTPEYVRQTGAFLRASDDLLEAAKQRDLEGAPLAYVSLTMSCVQCHRYVARTRIARGALER
jgi:cytochrome c556